MNGRYDDIINLPCPVFPGRRQMPPLERAAQFAPFAALTGFEAEIAEKARFTDCRRMADEGRANRINESLNMLSDRIKSHPGVRISYFRPDSRKSGGSYITGACRVKKIDEYERYLITDNNERIPIDDIFDIEFLQEYESRNGESQPVSRQY